jgi:CheY-like chemotaxis protein
MGRPIRVLLIEDDESDALLILDQLERGGWEVTWKRVQTRDEMNAALDSASYDLIVSDYSMPAFRAPEALEVWRERGLDLPFLVASGTIGEDHAVEVLKAGAHDFFLKDRLSRFGSAVDRELREAESRRTLRRTEEELRRTAAIVDSSEDAIFGISMDGVVTSWNAGAERLYGYPARDAIGRHVDFLSSATRSPRCWRGSSTAAAWSGWRPSSAAPTAP